MRIILASKSPRRKQLLTQMGVLFDIMSAKSEEIISPNLSYGEIVSQIAMQKAKEIFDMTTGDRLVIGSDTLVCKDIIMGKPKDKSDAKNMLKLLSGSTHHVFTGLAVIVERQDKTTIYNTFDDVEVTFKTLTEKIIDKYVESGEPMDKAGAYAIQGIGSMFVDKINGNPSAVMGLPVEKLYDIFCKENIDILQF